MDQGRDLAVSPTGPWGSHLKANGFAFPVIQHHPKMTVRNTVNITSPAMPKDPVSSHSSTIRYSHSSIWAEGVHVIPFCR
jgi:hypothetical protein